MCVAGRLLPGTPEAATPTPTKTFSFARNAPDPATRCLKFPADARKVVIPGTDGVELAGAEVGSGPRGLVLLHQRGGDVAAGRRTSPTSSRPGCTCWPSTSAARG
ncbi:hypothetical protein ACFQX7_19230 [Luedemannella flava]